jgi:hypothetical protein
VPFLHTFDGLLAVREPRSQKLNWFVSFFFGKFAGVGTAGSGGASSLGGGSDFGSGFSAAPSSAGASPSCSGSSSSSTFSSEFFLTPAKAVQKFEINLFEAFVNFFISAFYFKVKKTVKRNKFLLLFLFYVTQSETV